MANAHSHSSSAQPSSSHGRLPVWSIRLFFSEAIALLKRRSEIWILVILVILFSGSSSSGNFNSLSDLGNSSDSQEETTSKSEKTSDLLDDELTETQDEAQNIRDEDLVNEEEAVDEDEDSTEISSSLAESPAFQRLPADQQASWLALVTDPWNILHQISWKWYLLLGIGLIVMFAWVVVYGFIASAWVRASLSWAVYQESQLATWKLSEAVQAGSKLIGSFIWLNVVPVLLLLFIVGISAVGFTILLAVLVAATQVLPWLVVIVALLVLAYIFMLLYGLFKFAVVNEVSQRLVIARSLPAHEAFQQAFGWTKGMSGKLFRLSLSEGFCEFAVVIAVLLPLLAAVFIMGVAFGMWSSFDQSAAIFSSWQFISSAGGIVVLFLATIIAMELVKIGFVGFHTALWQMAWNYLAAVKDHELRELKAAHS